MGHVKLSKILAAAAVSKKTKKQGHLSCFGTSAPHYHQYQELKVWKILFCLRKEQHRLERSHIFMDAIQQPVGFNSLLFIFAYKISQISLFM